MAQMSVNYEAVSVSINQVSTLVADIQTRTTKFSELVSSKNEATNGKWGLLKTLGNKLASEVDNINGIIAAEDEIKASLNRYAEAAAEVDDDSALR